MREPVVFITGASGEIGHGLIHRLHALGDHKIVTLDLKPLADDVEVHVTRAFQGSITDKNALDGILAEFEVDMVFHLAALLSTRSELIPVTAHQVNVEGTLHLLEFAQAQAQSHGRPVRFLYPSSIAAYGMPDLDAKRRAGKVPEDQWNLPSTMYGCNKLYCEHLGNYYAKHYRQLDAERPKEGVDFRSIRFPGLISAATVPSGGTSDYAPEMIHAAAQRKPYACFVREDTRIPFMAMPDAVDALVQLARVERSRLTRCVYNIGAFNPSALEVCELVRAAFPAADIRFAPDQKRQAIVDSWPEDVDDAAARRDWGLDPRYDLERAFEEYLFPEIRQRYGA